MKKQVFYIAWMACLSLCVLPGCKKEQKLEQPPTETPSAGTGEKPSEGGESSGETVYLGGYARPDGVLILNQGAPAVENSSITYLAPDGTIEEECTER